MNKKSKPGYDKYNNLAYSLGGAQSSHVYDAPKRIHKIVVDPYSTHTFFEVAGLFFITASIINTIAFYFYYKKVNKRLANLDYIKRKQLFCQHISQKYRSLFDKICLESPKEAEKLINRHYNLDQKAIPTLASTCHDTASQLRKLLGTRIFYLFISTTTAQLVANYIASVMVCIYIIWNIIARYCLHKIQKRMDRDRLNDELVRTAIITNKGNNPIVIAHLNNNNIIAKHCEKVKRLYGELPDIERIDALSHARKLHDQDEQYKNYSILYTAQRTSTILPRMISIRPYLLERTAYLGFSITLTAIAFVLLAIWIAIRSVDLKIQANMKKRDNSELVYLKALARTGNKKICERFKGHLPSKLHIYQLDGQALAKYNSLEGRDKALFSYYIFKAHVYAKHSKYSLATSYAATIAALLIYEVEFFNFIFSLQRHTAPISIAITTISIAIVIACITITAIMTISHHHGAERYAQNECKLNCDWSWETFNQLSHKKFENRKAAYERLDDNSKLAICHLGNKYEKRAAQTKEEAINTTARISFTAMSMFLYCAHPIMIGPQILIIPLLALSLVLFAAYCTAVISQAKSKATNYTTTIDQLIEEKLQPPLIDQISSNHTENHKVTPMPSNDNNATKKPEKYTTPSTHMSQTIPDKAHTQHRKAA